MSTTLLDRLLQVPVPRQQPRSKVAAARADRNAFATSLYYNVLGRAPDAQGLAYWDRALESGALNRDQVVLGFWNSPERLARQL